MNAFLAFLLVAILLGLPPPHEDWRPLVVLALLPAVRFFVQGTTTCRWAALLGLLTGLAAAHLESETRQELAALVPPLAPVSVTGVVADREDRADNTVLYLADPCIDHQPVTGQLRLIVGNKTPVTALPGDRVGLQVKFFPRKTRVSPGSMDLDNYYAGQGVALQGKVLNTTVAGEGDSGDWRWNRLRQEISQQVATVVPPERRGLTEAMLVGKRGWLDRELRERLQASGIYHMISISGLHMTLVAGWSFLALRFLLVLIVPLSRRHNLKPAAALLSMVPTLAYGLLSGWSVATQRAALMALVFILAMVLGRAGNAWRALALTAIMLLVWRPSQLYDPGFQLSFLAVATILFMVQWFKNRAIHNRWLQELAITLVVGTVLSPVIAHYFHMVSWYGFFANLATVPWSSVTTVPLGFLAILVWPFSLSWFHTLIQWMSWSLEPMRWVGEWNLALPGGWWRTPGPPLLAVVAAVVTLSLVSALPRRWRAATMALAFALTLWPRTPLLPGKLLFAALDVGQAQATVLRDGDGGWHVVDAGGTVSTRFHVAEGVQSPFIWQFGGRRLERIILSHPQRDHMAGVARLLENFPTRELWVGHFPREETNSPAYRALLATARRLGTRIVPVSAGDEVQEGGLTLRVIHPPAPPHRGGINNNAVTILARYGQTALLLPADLEKSAIRKLMATQTRLQVDLMLAPHHGAASSRVAGFPQWIKPKHLLISVGATNPYHFPNPGVVRDWARAGARIWRTDLEGTLLFASDGQSFEPVILD